MGKYGGNERLSLRLSVLLRINKTPRKICGHNSEKYDEVRVVCEEFKL